MKNLTTLCASDQIHYMDPEDLFLESSNIPEIEYHNILNAEFLAELQAANKSFRLWMLFIE